jgi:hypothetical protein
VGVGDGLFLFVVHPVAIRGHNDKIYNKDNVICCVQRIHIAVVCLVIVEEEFFKDANVNANDE